MACHAFARFRADVIHTHYIITYMPLGRQLMPLLIRHYSADAAAD